MIIPDGCLIVAAAAWVLFLPLTGMGWSGARGGLIAALVFGGGLLGLSLVMDRILKRDSLGGGDIKLFAVLGLYLGVVGTLCRNAFHDGAGLHSRPAVCGAAPRTDGGERALSLRTGDCGGRGGDAAVRRAADQLVYKPVLRLDKG